MDPAVTVHTRKQDAEVAEEAAAAAQETYRNLTGRGIDFYIKGDLPEDG